jgi:hypothetical protein
MRTTPKHHLLKTKRALIATVVAGAIVVGGSVAAYAYWTSSGGTGNGSASTGSQSNSFTIAQTAAPTNMAPGVPAGNITGTIQNTGANDAHVVSVTVSIASVTQAEGAVGTCGTGDYTLSNPVMPVGADLVPNATPTQFSGATLGFNDSLTADQDGCQGATVNLAFASN